MRVDSQWWEVASAHETCVSYVREIRSGQTRSACLGVLLLALDRGRSKL